MPLLKIHRPVLRRQRTHRVSGTTVVVCDGCGTIQVLGKKCGICGKEVRRRKSGAK
jgi:rRNA maturation endonuclease Nob1